MRNQRVLQAIICRRGILPKGLSGLVAVVLSALLLLPGTGVIAPSSDYRIVPSWFKTTICVTGDVHLTVKFISEFHIYGAIEGLPVLLMMELESSDKNLESFTVRGMSVDGITPRGGSAELLDVNIDPIGLKVEPGMSVEWCFMVVPHYAKKPPLQVQLSADSAAQGAEFSIRTNVIFRTPGSDTATPISLTHVFLPGYIPWLKEDSWGGITYYYSIEASYPVGKGISLYAAELVLVFTTEYPMVSDSIRVFLDGVVDEVVHLEISDTVASGRIAMNGGTYLSPGYLQDFHLGIEFSLEMPEQDIGWAFSAETT